MPMRRSPSSTSSANSDEGVPQVVEFLTRSDQASSWALRILAVLDEQEVTALVTAELARLSVDYTRDPEKKEVLLHWLEGKVDERIGPVVVAFLTDTSDDVKMCALKTLSSLKFEPAREAVLEGFLLGEETAKRVQTACVAMLFETGFLVTGYREKVEARLAPPFFVDRAGAVRARLAPLRQTADRARETGGQAARGARRTHAAGTQPTCNEEMRSRSVPRRREQSDAAVRGPVAGEEDFRGRPPDPVPPAGE